MQHDEFIGQGQNLAQLSSRGDAERATRATLETLGERIPEGLADNLAAQLPHEIGEHLRRTVVYGGAAAGARFSRQQFIALVAERAGVQEAQAAHIIWAVMEILGRAASPRLIAKVDESLPAELRDLVTADHTSEENS